MKKSFLKNILITILLLGNCFFIITHLMRPPHPNHEGPRNEIVTTLHFDEQQIAKYDVLIKKHQTDIRAAEKKLLSAKNKLYGNLEQKINESYLNAVLAQQAVIERIHFAHFQDIKLLCKPNQQVYFKQLNKKIAQLFTHRMKPKK